MGAFLLASKLFTNLNGFVRDNGLLDHNKSEVEAKPQKFVSGAIHPISRKPVKRLVMSFHKFPLKFVPSDQDFAQTP